MTAKLQHNEIPQFLKRRAQVAFGFAFLIWFWLLIKPNPFPELAKQLHDWGELLNYLAAKSLHFTVYALLTVLAAMSTKARNRWILYFLVIAHAVLSEVGQYYGNLWFNTGRGGHWRDVIIDTLGIGVGYFVWRWLRWQQHWSDARL